MELNKLKIRRNHLRRNVDQYCESLNSLILKNAHLNEINDCFMKLEDRAEQLDSMNDRILELPDEKTDESKIEEELNEIDIYRDKWLTARKKYLDFKEQNSCDSNSLAQHSASQSNLHKLQTDDKTSEILTEQLLEEIKALKEDFKTFSKDYAKHERFFPGNIPKQTVDEIKTSVREIETKLQMEWNRIIDQYRLGNLNLNKLTKLLSERKEKIVNLRKAIGIQESIMKKEFQDQEAYLNKDIIHLDENDSLEEVVFQKDNLDSFVFHWHSGSSTANQLLNSFMNMADHRRDNEQFVIIEYKVDSTNTQKDEIIYYRGRKIISRSGHKKENTKNMENAKDLLNFVKLKEGKNFHSTRKNNTPSTPFQLICPGFELGTCKKELLTWNCSVCKEVITQRMVKNYLFCKCGRVKSHSLTFKCSSTNHGDSYLPINFPSHAEDNQDNTKKITPKEELNILILGQSGVGKSTWINGLVNYSEYNTLDEAEKKGVKHVIPASFSVNYIKDGKSETQKVKVGEDDLNENVAVGKSATRKPKTYLFPAEDRTVRLIDTPGLGDTEGIHQDQENMRKILDHISIYDRIHGICILLKANETRIGPIFKYCIMEMLVHLHRSAAKNILFCFTNSRTAFYTGGDTIPVLSGLLQELKLDDLIQLKQNTMFYLDNEAFRYLCMRSYPQIPSKGSNEKKIFADSWEKSVEETRRLFRTITELEPHVVADTTTLCNARKRIINLTRPIGDITQTIKLNVEMLDRNRESIKNWDQDFKELKKKLRIPQIVLEPEALPHGRMVCTNAKCTESYILEHSGYTQTEYKQICHEICSLRNIPPDTVQNEDLRRCHIFNYDNNERMKCGMCKCYWYDHMYITYSQKRVEKYEIDPIIDQQIKDRKTVKNEVEKHEEELKNLIEMYKEEEKILVKTSSKFAAFLKKFSIVTYNDCLEKYLQYLIDQETKRGDESYVQNLRKTLDEYKKETETLQKEIKKVENKDSRESKLLTPENMAELEQNLYKLKLTGEQLKKISDVASSSYQSAQIKAEDLWLTKNIFSF